MEDEFWEFMLGMLQFIPKNGGRAGLPSEL
jgi:hypothetical protein